MGAGEHRTEQRADVHCSARPGDAHHTLRRDVYGGVFKSVNSGGNWTPANTGLSALTVYALAVDPQTTGTLYAGTLRGGVFKSTDSGGAWQPVNTGLAVRDIRALAIAPETPATLYAGAYGGGVFKSTDGGATWQARIPG